MPPLIGFSSIRLKDSLNNIEATGEFVCNLVTRKLVEVMNQTSEAGHILRGSGPADYFTIGPEPLLKM